MLALTGCGDSPAGVGPETNGPFPALLSELQVDAPEAQRFVPEWPLWTNGASKERRIWLTEGGRVEIGDSGSWRFPEGTRLTKTFSYRTAASPNVPVPIETRVIMKVDGEWETAVYRWRADLSDAELLPDDERTPVSVTLSDGTALEHLIPNGRDCQVCHGSAPSFVLGFSELQLNSTLPGEAVSQLEQFAAMGYFDHQLPADPEQIAATDERTRRVLGYVQGNCVHCHNVSSPATELDLSHQVFMENTVGRPASNGLTLIHPNDPDSSFLFEQIATGRMPPVGVQRLDAESRELLREWILEHDFGS